MSYHCMFAQSEYGPTKRERKGISLRYSYAVRTLYPPPRRKGLYGATGNIFRNQLPSIRQAIVNVDDDMLCHHQANTHFRRNFNLHPQTSRYAITRISSSVSSVSTDARCASPAQVIPICPQASVRRCHLYACRVSSHWPWRSA